VAFRAGATFFDVLKIRKTKVLEGMTCDGRRRSCRYNRGVSARLHFQLTGIYGLPARECHYFVTSCAGTHAALTETSTWKFEYTSEVLVTLCLKLNSRRWLKLCYCDTLEFVSSRGLHTPTRGPAGPFQAARSLPVPTGVH
jgi:hypothetical protein